MSLSDRLWYALVAIPGASLDRLFWYVTLAGFAWLTLHVILSPWLQRRRISDKPPAFWQMSREVLFSLRSLVVYGLVGGFIVFSITSKWTQMYFRFDDYGWTWFYASIGVTILIHDTYFYWTHRLMHHPRLFRWMHRTHHLSTNPSPWAAYSFSTGEAFVQAGIAPLVIFTLPLHPPRPGRRAGRLQPLGRTARVGTRCTAARRVECSVRHVAINHPRFPIGTEQVPWDAARLCTGWRIPRRT